ncbi:DUF4952 domain-containing protein [Gilliamella sp. Pas-s27]|uniref:DUF4952 domain-containing protein n=1 Tax=Gilliamella sp. Pas-s27 TaxID=2687311 RepID=UPI0013653B70|nr:DUF4952 domain-containing protein [Gilliamella sp. Pas-s27]MWP46665.1 DUF4952 domain-containing protein [Gilliamella sp. Pas-s27]
MHIRKFIFMFCLFCCSIFPVWSDDNSDYINQQIDIDNSYPYIEQNLSDLHRYIENGDYHKVYSDYVKLMKKTELYFPKKVYVQRSLAWLILNGYGTEQDLHKAVDLYYDVYRDSNQFNHDLMMSEVNAAHYISQQEKLWNLMFVDIVSNSHYVSAKQKSDLFATLFPNNPNVLIQFNEQISELKKTKLRNVKIKHPEYFPHYYYDPDLTCRDFLREFDADAPDFFKYNDCIKNDKGQGKPLEVIYKIEGKYAKQAHQYLANTMGISELKLICCYWGTDGYPSTSFVNPKDHMLYSVVFSSEETIEYDWNKITFYLSIKALREDI